MKRLFQKFPLSVKLMLLGIVPLFFFIYMSVRYYIEKDKNASRFKKNIVFIQQTVNISNLIDELQEERKLSFEKAQHIEHQKQIAEQYERTDSIINAIKASRIFPDFTKYTFIDSLREIRLHVDSNFSQDIIMHYYTTVIFRLGTLSAISPFENIYLKPTYKDLKSQRLLSEMANYLGIIRANIYNVLSTGQNAQGTLYGLIGVYDIFKSYETEFLLNASPGNIQHYKIIRNSSALNETISFLDDRFKKMSFDSSIKKDEWWAVSEQAKKELRDLQNSILSNAVTNLGDLYKAELRSKNRTLIILVISVFIVISIVSYTIYSITGTLNKMKRAAQKLAKGITGIKLNIQSKDPLGSLARSINLIEENYKLLAETAVEIGKGNFDVPMQPRGPEDTLGKALLEMKYDLQELTRQQRLRQQHIAESVLKAQEQERTKIGQELHDNVNQLLATVKLYLDHAQKSGERIENISRATEIVSLAINEIRKISHALILPTLRGDNLIDSINTLVTDVRRISALTVHVHTDDFNEELLTENQKITIFRIIQEQLNNILKYASASLVTIIIKNKHGQFQLLIEDDGKGFDLKATKKGVGIKNIYNRAELLNGSVVLDTSPGTGCRLKVALSLAN